MIRGLVLGKFMPPHLGHLHLIEVAAALCDQLTIVVGTLADEPIDGALRYRWMTEMCPQCEVVHLADELPQDPSETADFWSLWEASLRRVLAPALPQRVFASEPYGAKLAELFAAEFVPVDVDRQAISTSGTAIRDDPASHWNLLPRPVRRHFARRVCVFGPESTGKSILAAKLADRLDATLVPEIARAILEHRGEPRETDMVLFAAAQQAAEDAAAAGPKPLIICDTDALTTAIWSDALFGEIHPEVAARANRDYDLTLLCDIDVPFVSDPVRYLPGSRQSFFDRCRAELEQRGRRFVVIRGDWDARLELARTAITDTARKSWRTRRET